MADKTQSNAKGDLKHRLATKALMPIVATAASAAAGYAAKKGPRLFEDKVLPKLKQTASGTGDVAGDLVERAKDAVPIGGDGTGSGSPNRDLSSSELQRHVQERAQARAARRKATARR